MEGTNGWIRSNRTQGGHVENATDIDTATLDVTPSAMSTRVVIEGSDADQSRDLTSGKSAELGKAGEHGMRGDRTDSFTAPKQIVLLTPGGSGTDLFVEVFIQLFDVLFQPLDVFFDDWANGGRGRMKLVLLGSKHGDHLTAPRADGLQGLSGFIGNRAEFRPDLFAELGEDIPVDGVGLGQAPRRTSEITSLAGIDGDGRQTRAQQPSQQQTMISAGSFHDDQSGTQGLEAFNEHVDAFVIIGKTHPLNRWPNRNIEMIFGNINSNEL